MRPTAQNTTMRGERTPLLASYGLAKQLRLRSYLFRLTALHFDCAEDWLYPTFSITIRFAFPAYLNVVLSFHIFVSMDRLPSETESVFDVFRQAGKQVIHYLLWFFCFALGLGLILLLHEVLEVVLFLRVNPWHLRAYRLWSIFLLGMALIVSMFLVEGYLRRSRRDGRHFGALLTVLSVQLTLIGFSAAALYFTEIRDFLLF